MGTRFLRHFLEPESLVVIGPVAEGDATAITIVRNLVAAGFTGQLHAVALDAHQLPGSVQVHDSLAKLPAPPDLAILCAPIEAAEGIIMQLGRHGIRAAMILSGPPQRDTHNCYQRLLRAALTAGVRVLGPECRGLAVPARRLDATCATAALSAGRVAYVGQSGMLGNAMIDWAAGRGLGLSHLVTLGESIDVRLPDLIDYLNHQGSVRALIMHVEYVFDAMHFMTALREASRRRLVLAIKSGRTAATELDDMPATPGVAHRDLVFDAALARAGVVRVTESDELFEALEALSRSRTHTRGGERLAIVANGLGPAMLALDRLVEQGGCMAEFSADTREALRRERLDHSRPGFNPVDLDSDATPERFIRALTLLADDDNVDAILLIHAPTGMAPSLATAQAVIECWQQLRTPLFTSWMGLSTARQARDACHQAGLATHVTPEKAVRAFMMTNEYRRVQSLLQQMPSTLAFDTPVVMRERCHALIEDARHRGRDRLTHEETAMALNAYGIATAPAIYIKTTEEAYQRFDELSHPVALKAVHRDNCQPFRADRRPDRPAPDLMQDLDSVAAVVSGMATLERRIADERYNVNKTADGSIYSFCLQPMQRGKQSLQLSAGVTRDSVFGPIIVFGLGGYRADVMSDRRLALPPLNATLARHLIESSHAAVLIREQSSQPEQDFERLTTLLTRLSQMCTDLGELRGLEINPLLLNRDQLVAVDFALDLGPPARHAIMPYPEELRERVTLRNGWPVELRPVRSEDAELIREFHGHLSERSIRYRYFHHKAVLSAQDLAELTQLDYDRQMAFLAEYRPQSEGGRYMLGVSRVWNDPDNIRTEFSIIVRDDLQGIGLGRLLMQKLIAWSRSVGTLEMVGQIRADNRGMRALAVSLGFRVRLDPEEQTLALSLRLNEPINDWQRHRLENLRD